MLSLTKFECKFREGNSTLIAWGFLNKSSRRKPKRCYGRLTTHTSFAMVSIKISDEGIKRNVEGQGSSIETIKNESTRLFCHNEVWFTKSLEKKLFIFFLKV